MPPSPPPSGSGCTREPPGASSGPSGRGPCYSGAGPRSNAMIGSVFRDRDEAGAALAAVLAERVSGPTSVLAIPRGGVAVALPVARSLGASLDVVIPRKLRAPDNP